MTTAHRATWHPAIASARQTNLRSSISDKDMANYTKIKYRQRGQGSAEELAKRDLKKELEERERAYKAEQEKQKLRAGELPAVKDEDTGTTKPPAPVRSVDDIDDVDDVVDDEAKVNLVETKTDRHNSASTASSSAAAADDGADSDVSGTLDQDYDDSDLSFSEAEEVRRKSKKGGPADGASVGASESSDDDDDYDDDDDSEDSEEELRRVLEQVRREREEEAKRKKAAEEAAASHQEALSALASNPLLAAQLGQANENEFVATKRRWDDDIVFRNQAREVKDTKKRFTNDIIRSDFHRAFLNKYFK